MPKPPTKVIYITLILTALCILWGGNAFCAKVIKLTSDPYCPLICDPKKEGKSGYMVDVARAVFEESGYSVELYIRPWSRGILDVRYGKYDGLVGCWKNHAPDFIFPENEIGKSSAKFYVRKGNPWRFNGIKSLKKVKFGIVQDYDYSDEKDYIRDNPDKVDAVAGEDALERNIKKIMLGRIDVIEDNETVVQYTLKKLGLRDQIIEAGTDKKPDYYFIAFSPKNPKSKKYAKILSDGIMKLRQTGKLGEILDKYGIKDWK